MEALKAELAAATQRADTAEAKRREADEQLETIKKKDGLLPVHPAGIPEKRQHLAAEMPRSAAAGGRAAKSS